MLWRHTLDGVVVLAPLANEPCSLRGPAGRLWDALVAARPAEELAAIIASDPMPLLQDLLERGLVERVS